jgi:hypothetical protein
VDEPFDREGRRIVKSSTASASRTEIDAYSNILSNLRVLAQELQSRDMGEFQVTETIRTNLLQMVDSLRVSPEEMQSGWA